MFSMNRLSKYILLGTAAIFTACSEETPSGVIAEEGDEVKFEFNVRPNSRTMYQDDWDATTNQELYWGNYLPDTQGKDYIRIYGVNAAAGRNIAKYEVIPSATNSNTAASITKTETIGVQWGSSDAEHTFYSFYPADKCGENFVGGDGVISAQVAPGQAPPTYKAVMGTETHTNNAVAWVNANETASEANQTIVYGQPDMSAAIMAARTQVPVADYGKPVGLHFHVLADVLDLTINGPITPNTLNGTTAKNSIKIKNVIIKSKSGKSLSGNFTLDLNSLNSNDGTGAKVNVTNGTSTVQLATAQVVGTNTLYPNLYVRSDKTGVNAVVDKLRLRAFLIPGQVTNLDDLEITIQTDCGDYTQPLNSAAMVSGQIHPIKLKYFTQAGVSFDFGSWIKQLDPAIYLSELSLPGSWNAYAFSSKTNHSKDGSYQSLDFAGQYQAGVRAFQLNVSATKSRGSVNAPKMVGSNTTLTAILDDIAGYMSGHTDEYCVVLLARKNESGAFVSNATPAEWLGKVKEVLNSNQNIYNTEITAETTIGDVVNSGRRIIVKINSEPDLGITEVPALFSQWEEESVKQANTIALQWGSPIAPNASSSLKWCYTEADNIGSASGTQATVQERQDAMLDLEQKSLEAYRTGNHNTWFECAIGGYLTTSGWTTSTSTTELAKAINPLAIQVLANANRQACPMGIVLMNFAGDPAYQGDELITTIINNNRAFVLQKRGGATPQNVKDKTNMSFDNNPGNAIK